MSQLQHVTIGADGDPCAGAALKAGKRDANFDFLKGFLVLVMVAHHALGYFAGKTFPLIKYLDFVTGGFVFAAGFLPMFLLRFGSTPNRIRVASRLLKRGVKLIALFLLVNVILGAVLGGTPHGKSLILEDLFQNLGMIMVGSDKSLAAFLILVPIAYTFLLLAIFILSTQERLLVVSTGFSLLFYCTWNLDVSFNLYYVAMGLAGGIVGVLVPPELHAIGDQVSSRLILLLGAAAYMLSISFLQKDNGLLYATGTFFVLALVYFLASKVRPLSWVFNYLVILGQYSLVAYLSQILIIQMLYQFRSWAWLQWGLGLVPFVLTCVVLAAFCFALDYLRKSEAKVNSVYRFVFA